MDGTASAPDPPESAPPPPPQKTITTDTKENLGVDGQKTTHKGLV